MKYKNLLIILAVVFLFVFAVVAVRKSDNSGNSDANNVQTTAKGVKIALSQDPVISTQPYSTDDSRVHISFTPMVNVALETDDPSITPVAVEIQNLNLTKKPKLGKFIRVYPTTLSLDESCIGWYFESCDNALDVDDVKDMGPSGVFKVVENPTTHGELPPYLGPVRFSFYLLDVGTFDKDAVKREYGSFSSRDLLKYADINPDDLNGTVEFDLVVKLSDGSQVAKHFTGDITKDAIASGEIKLRS